MLKKDPISYQIDRSLYQNFLNKRLIEKPVKLTAEKKDLVIVFPFLAKLSLDLRIRLKNSISKTLLFCKIRVIFKSLTRISNFLQLEDKMLYCVCSNVVYRFPLDAMLPIPAKHTGI